MPVIKIHDYISVVNGFVVAHHKSGNNLFLERDITYGSSALYAWYMGFVLIGLTTYEKMKSPALINDKTALGKFVSQLEKAIQQDLHFDINSQGEKLLEQSGLDNTIMCCEPDNKFTDLFIINHLNLKSALVVELEIEGFNESFTMLVTAIEENSDKTIKILYCLSPDNSEEPQTHWNAVFVKDDKNNTFPYCWVDFADGETQRAKLVKTLALMTI